MRAACLVLFSLFSAFTDSIAETSWNFRGQIVDPTKLSAAEIRGADSECQELYTAAVDRGATVFARADASRKYRRCIESLGRAFVLSARSAAVSSEAAGAMIESMVNDAKAMEAESNAAAEFMDLSWGVGFGFSFSQDEVIDEADLVDGRIRSTKDSSDQPRALLEFHRYFWCNKKQTLSDRGCGPFLAVSATPDKALSGVGIGFIFGRRVKNPTDQQGFSIGIGAILDANVRSLADGFDKNHPLPPGESSIRFEERSRWSTILFVTRSF